MMGIFDELIGDNKKPKKGVEYIYMLDMVWKLGKSGELRSFDIKPGTIVVDVEKRDNGSFRFNLKEGGDDIYETNYGWSLAENTPENILKINEYEKFKIVVEESKKELKKLRSLIVDLGEEDVLA